MLIKHGRLCTFYFCSQFCIAFASNTPSSSSYQLNRKYHLSLSVKDWRYPVIERLYSAVYANCFFFFLSNMLKRAKIVPLYIIDLKQRRNFIYRIWIWRNEILDFNPFWKKSRNMQSKKINRLSEASQIKKEGYSIQKW